ncbi:helix-turn-helix transcriptional regulator [Gorillibacterium sp. CAU 1737]|uniref:helix-turn-helix transcriptional regulator n=1 Tax=Gorillibacterium sp. CAU 1737 TaxID=3140362 RepID=UPI003261AD83
MTIHIAGNLKRLRKERSLTQEDLAGFLGVSFQAISKWERGDGYPDLPLLPVIARFFDVTLDELMGMNEIRREERLHDFHAQWNENNAKGNHADNILLMREALREYPNDYLLMAQLVTSLEKCEASPAERVRNRAEAIELSERIVEHCPDAEIRNAFLFNVCHSYWRNGDTEKAIKGARQLPTIYKTQENALVMFLEGKEKIQIGQQAIVALIVSLFQQISYMKDTDHYSPEEKGLIVSKFCSVADLLMEEDDVPILLRYKASAYMDMAELALKQHENESAIDYLQSAADCAIKSIHSLKPFIPASLLANGQEVSAITPSDFRKLHMLQRFSSKEYDPLRTDARFQSLYQSIEEAERSIRS